MKKVLIDTDVILDSFLDRKPFSEFSTIILAMCENQKIQGFVTPVIFSHTYYILRRVGRHEKVIEKLTQLLSITNILSMDRNVIQQAIVSEFRDFEDALQNFAAVSSGNIDVIVTRNIKDFKKSELGVLTPESFLKII